MKLQLAASPDFEILKALAGAIATFVAALLGSLTAPWIKAKFDSKLENEKAQLQRKAKIRDRQLEPLMSLANGLSSACASLSQSAFLHIALPPGQFEEHLRQVQIDLEALAALYQANLLVMPMSIGLPFRAFVLQAHAVLITIHRMTDRSQGLAEEETASLEFERDRGIKKLEDTCIQITSQCYSVLHG